MSENNELCCLVCNNEMEKLLVKFDKKIKKQYGLGHDILGDEIDEIPEIGDSEAPNDSFERDQYTCGSNNNYWYRYFKYAYRLSEPNPTNRDAIGYFSLVYYNVKALFRTKVDSITLCMICESYLSRQSTDMMTCIFYSNGGDWIYNPDAFLNNLVLAKNTVLLGYLADNNTIENAYKEIDEDIERIKILKKDIIKLLKDKNIKVPASDIDAFLKHQDVDEIKELCEEMYQDGDISFAGNGRYFVLTKGADEKKEAKTKSENIEEVDVKSELKKYKEMLDEGLIEKEDYEAKKKELLGL